MKYQFENYDDNHKKIILTILLAFIFTLSLCFVITWNTQVEKSTEEYIDVDYEWDDDFDRYDIFIENLGHFYISTDKATLVYLPDENLINYALIIKTENIFHQKEETHLKKFYLNIGYKGEE